MRAKGCFKAFCTGGILMRTKCRTISPPKRRAAVCTGRSGCEKTPTSTNYQAGLIVFLKENFGSPCVLDRNLFKISPYRSFFTGCRYEQ